MKISFVDTNLIIRAITGDDLAMAKSSADLFRRVSRGEEAIIATQSVIFDAVFVLEGSIYKFPRESIRDVLSKLIKLPEFKLEAKTILLGALDVYASSNLDFGDAIIVATMRASGITDLYSYDKKHFDNITDISRIEP